MNSKIQTKWIKIVLGLLAVLFVLGAIYTMVSFYLQKAYVDSLPDGDNDFGVGLGLAISLIYFRIPNAALNAIAFIYSLALLIKFSNSVKKNNVKLRLVATVPFLILIIITLFFTYLAISSSVYFDLFATIIGVLQLAGGVIALIYSIKSRKIALDSPVETEMQNEDIEIGE